MDTSIHDWTEGRGEPMVLVNMIDDATSRVLSGFYQGETVEAHFDLQGPLDPALWPAAGLVHRAR
ncbi:MAG TPA: hypothetical protein VH592_08055 [Gemmataceae bacterium]